MTCVFEAGVIDSGETAGNRYSSSVRLKEVTLNADSRCLPRQLMHRRRRRYIITYMLWIHNMQPHALWD